VFSWTGEQPPDRNRPLDSYYDDNLGRLMTYTMEVLYASFYTTTKSSNFFFKFQNRFAFCTPTFHHPQKSKAYDFCEAFFYLFFFFFNLHSSSLAWFPSPPCLVLSLFSGCLFEWLYSPRGNIQADLYLHVLYAFIVIISYGSNYSAGQDI
jgi:hypothetical protein